MVLTDLSWLAPGKPFPPQSEIPRLAKYERNRLLWKGDHELVFPQLTRMFRDTEADHKKIKVVLNWPKRLSLLWPDLLFGEKPRINAGKPQSPEQDALDRIIATNNFWAKCHICAIDSSRYGDGLLKVRFDADRGVLIENLPPKYWFPIADDSAGGYIKQHAIAWIITRPVDGVPVRFLRVELHEPGSITNQIYELTKENKIVQKLTWPFFDDDNGIDEIQLTGVDRPLIVQIPNLKSSDDIFGEDDYSDIVPILRRMETRLTRVGRILDHHSEPLLVGPQSLVDVNPVTGEATHNTDLKTIPLNPDDKEPKYITWDGQITGSISELNFLKAELYSISETCPTAFGEALSGSAPSGTALRLRMMTPLKKCERLRSIAWNQGIKDILYLASALEVVQGVKNAMLVENPNITWYDGLPLDETEAVANEVAKVSSEISSKRSAIKRLGDLDDAAADAEMAEIQKEKGASSPVEPPEITPLEA